VFSIGEATFPNPDKSGERQSRLDPKHPITSSIIVKDLWLTTMASECQEKEIDVICAQEAEDNIS
jgi:hypothetical protein